MNSQLSAHWNHRLTLQLATILPLLGERAGVRADLSRRSAAQADVSSSRRDWLPSRFMVREQFQSEQATAHETRDDAHGVAPGSVPECARPRAQQRLAGWDDGNFPTCTRPRTLLCPRRAHPGEFMVREQFQSEQATAHDPWILRSLESAAYFATADDSPSPGGEGWGEGGRIILPQGLNFTPVQGFHARMIHSGNSLPMNRGSSGHWNHYNTASLTIILPLPGERAGVRADVSSSRRDWLSSRFRGSMCKFYRQFFP